MIVGIASGRGEVAGCNSPCDRRLVEYVPDISPEGVGADAPFGRPLRFVTDQLIPYVERHYPATARREDRILAGYSAGAVWAVTAASMRPELFGNVLAMSAGGQRSAYYARQLKNARIFAGAGLFEPGFLRSTRERAELARQAGSEVHFREMVAGHSHLMWEILFADGIAWLLPAKQ